MKFLKTGLITAIGMLCLSIIVMAADCTLQVQVDVKKALAEQASDITVLAEQGAMLSEIEMDDYQSLCIQMYMEYQGDCTVRISEEDIDDHISDAEALEDAGDVTLITAKAFDDAGAVAFGVGEVQDGLGNVAAACDAFANAKTQWDSATPAYAFVQLKYDQAWDSYLLAMWDMCDDCDDPLLEGCTSLPV